MNQSTHEQASNSMCVPVALSPSHAHLTSGVIEQLFCDHYRLHEVSRVGLTQFAALELVSLIGPNGRTIDVPVIGPARQTDEVQLSKSDALKLGIDAPICSPGDHAGTPGILLKGPRSQVTLELGVIRALPHIHMTPQDADRLGLADRDQVDVVSEHDPQRILFRNVPVLVSINYRLELHLDADEGNASGLSSGNCVRLRKTAAMQVR
jgi:propanediol utilization protein